jgi:hypothetical protein
MTNEEQSSAEMYRVLQGWWIQNNTDFLHRYWSTAATALEHVVDAPENYAEFLKESDNRHITAAIASHREHHNFSGVLLTYAVFDEFMAILTKDLGRSRDARIDPGDLRDRGVKRYRKFVCQVCNISEEQLAIDWEFLEDFATVRNAIVHANGNKTLLRDATQLNHVVHRHPDLLGFKNESKLTVSDAFVIRCIKTTHDTALALAAAA